jgi:hypothetical protein
MYPLENKASGSEVIIKKMTIRSKTLTVKTTKPQGYIYGLYIVNFENAIKNGEILSEMLTPDKALEELKKWKYKLDLEIITQSQYDKKKKELIAIINE